MKKPNLNIKNNVIKIVPYVNNEHISNAYKIYSQNLHLNLGNSQPNRSPKKPVIERHMIENSININSSKLPIIPRKLSPLRKPLPKV